jgi:polysaccharide export outer membrane protein
MGFLIPSSKSNHRGLFLRTVAWVLLVSMSVVSGCIPNRKLIYVQDPAQAVGETVLYTSSQKPYKLQTGDVLSVMVKGVDQELQTTFNLSSGGMGGAVFADPGSQYVNGYSIDEHGDIFLTSVGKVHVRDLTVTEAAEVCQKRIANFLKEATVSVKMVSIKITILGEVNRPGYVFLQNPRCTILEGIGLGGDLTKVANRSRVKIFRQVNGNTEVSLVDLTSPDLIKSPYYYLQPNDVIYIEPFAGQTTSKNFAPVNLGLGVISGITTIVLLIYTLNNKK